MSSQLKYPVPTPPTPSLFFFFFSFPLSPPEAFIGAAAWEVCGVEVVGSRDVVLVQHSRERPCSAAVTRAEVTTTPPMQSSAEPHRRGAGVAEDFPHAVAPTLPWLGSKATNLAACAWQTQPLFSLPCASLEGYWS